MSKPYVAAGTNKRFYVPPTLAADFTGFLDNDIPNTVMDFTVYHNWYDQFKPEYEDVVVRGELYPDSSKSRYANTDNVMNIRCDVNSGIRKGDIIKDEADNLYILDWEVHLQSNNAPSRALRCNLYLTVERFHEAETDDEGFVLYDEHWDKVVHELPSNAYRYDGRPEYSAIAGTPGITPNALTLMTVQYNNETKNVRIGDRFLWGNEYYEIIDISRIGLAIDGEYGCLTLQAKKAAGGIQ